MVAQDVEVSAKVLPSGVLLKRLSGHYALTARALAMTYAFVPVASLIPHE